MKKNGQTLYILSHFFPSHFSYISIDEDYNEACVFACFIFLAMFLFIPLITKIITQQLLLAFVFDVRLYSYHLS